MHDEIKKEKLIKYLLNNIEMLQDFSAMDMATLQALVAYVKSMK